MDLNKSIRLAVDSGKVVLGLDKAKKIALNGDAKLIIYSKNCPGAQDLKHYCDLSGVSLLEFQGTSVELGAVCGKPFSVSVLCVQEAGDSDVLSVVKG
ncbi:50S ribosomal protein L30e [Candidatus Micrarchaeota archaeon]|nr:50S ribosomal protein L30e [Candidatus Micrarchaeota archaeon]